MRELSAPELNFFMVKSVSTVISIFNTKSRYYFDFQRLNLFGALCFIYLLAFNTPSFRH